MRPKLPTLCLLALALLALLTVVPAAAGSTSPAPVNDPFGVMLPLPGCGVAGTVVTTRLLHQVRQAPAPRQRRRRAARPTPPPAAETGALAWQALYGCAATLPEEASTRPLRPT